jgi:hypothetical protein
MVTEDVVAEGRAAWSRIRESGRRSWDDWMAVDVDELLGSRRVCGRKVNGAVERAVA